MDTQKQQMMGKKGNRLPDSKNRNEAIYSSTILQSNRNENTGPSFPNVRSRQLEHSPATPPGQRSISEIRIKGGPCGNSVCVPLYCQARQHPYIRIRNIRLHLRRGGE